MTAIEKRSVAAAVKPSIVINGGEASATGEKAAKSSG